MEISGNNSLIEDDLIGAIKTKLEGKYFWLFPKSNFFLISKNKISAELAEEFKRIKKITLGKKYFSGIVVKLEERDNSVLYCIAKNCAYVDDNGLVFEKAPYFSGAVFLKIIDQRELAEGENEETIEKKLGLRLMNNDEFKKISEFAKLIDKIGGGVLEIILKKENIYEFYTKEGWKIVLNDKNETEESYLNLTATLDSGIKEKQTKLDYVDLRLGNKVYFKYKQDGL